MTIGEFLAPIAKASLKDRTLAATYFATVQEGGDLFSSEQVRALLARARDGQGKKANIADVLNKMGATVECAGMVDGRNLWRLTDTGKAKVRSLLSLPEEPIEAAHEVAALESLLSGVSDPITREFLAEGVKCLRFNALRAAIVFIWGGAIRSIQETLIKKPRRELNDSLKLHDTKARLVSKIDDFAYVKDVRLLETAKDLGLFDKAQHETLEEHLRLRNKCGHPTKFRPKVNRVRVFIEEVIDNVFQ